MKTEIKKQKDVSNYFLIPVIVFVIGFALFNVCKAIAMVIAN